MLDQSPPEILPLIFRQNFHISSGGQPTVKHFTQASLIQHVLTSFYSSSSCCADELTNCRSYGYPIFLLLEI